MLWPGLVRNGMGYDGLAGMGDGMEWIDRSINSNEAHARFLLNSFTLGSITLH